MKYTNTSLIKHDMVSYSILKHNNTNYFQNICNRILDGGIRHMSFITDRNPKEIVEEYAGNNELWTINPLKEKEEILYSGKDIEYIKKTIKDIIVPDDKKCPSKVIVLGKKWELNPFIDSVESEKQGRWQGPVLVVIPEKIEQNELNHCLGVWMIRHILKHRNTLRFLLLTEDAENIYEDSRLINLARCCYLCSDEGMGSDQNYHDLLSDYYVILKDELKRRFNRFAILNRWDFQNTYNCIFHIENIDFISDELPTKIEDKIYGDLFNPVLLREYIIDSAINKVYLGAVIAELTETPALKNDAIAIPYIGESKIIGEILKIAAMGDIMLKISGTWIYRGLGEHDFSTALDYFKTNIPTSKGEQLEIQIGLPRFIEKSDVFEIKKRIIS